MGKRRIQSHHAVELIPLGLLFCATLLQILFKEQFLELISNLVKHTAIVMAVVPILEGFMYKGGKGWSKMLLAHTFVKRKIGYLVFIIDAIIITGVYEFIGAILPFLLLKYIQFFIPILFSWVILTYIAFTIGQRKEHFPKIFGAVSIPLNIIIWILFIWLF